MAFDFSDFKTEVFPGINDTPIAPTQTKAGNGPHLIKQVNNLIDEVENAFNQLEQSNGNFLWKIIGENYQTELFEYILLKATVDNTFELTLPSQPNIGEWIALCSFTNNNNITIVLNGALRFNGVPEPQVVFKGSRQPCLLIWTGNDSVGWMTTNASAFEVVKAGYLNE